MSVLERSHTSTATPSAVWAVLADYGNIADWHPGLSKSALLPGAVPQGVGAMRRCDMTDGNHLVERVHTWRDEAELGIDIEETSMPLKRAAATFKVRPSGGGSVITMIMDFTPKFGPLGWAMDRLMMRRMLSGKMDELLEAISTTARARPAVVAAE